MSPSLLTSSRTAKARPPRPCRTLKTGCNQISGQPKSFSCCGKRSTTRPSRSCTVVPSALTVFMPTRLALLLNSGNFAALGQSHCLFAVGDDCQKEHRRLALAQSQLERGAAPISMRTQTFLQGRNHEKHVSKRSSRNPLLSWTGLAGERIGHRRSHLACPPSSSHFTSRRQMTSRYRKKPNFRVNRNFSSFLESDPGRSLTEACVIKQSRKPFKGDI